MRRRVPIPSELHQETLLTTFQIEGLIGYSKATLETWRSRRIGPKFIKLESGAIRYRWADIQAWQAREARNSNAA